jgi:molybdate transport system ATP-binding protein
MGALGGEVIPAMLSVQIRKELHRANLPSFVLDLAFEIPPGITILFGPSGAGKSTLLDCLAGLARPDAGCISIDGELLFDSASGANLPPQKRKIAYVFQSLALFPHLDVESNVSYGLAKLSSEDRRARVDAALAAFHVEELKARKPAAISGGERQRVALARSLVTSPRVLLLDEPLAGLDAQLKSSIIDDLRAWNSAQRIPIVYVTHSREEVDALGERMIAIDHGRVIDSGPPQQVLDAPRRKRLAQAAGFENLLQGRVMDLRETDGVMRIRLESSECEIEVPLGYAAPGDIVRVAVRAGDILLATEQPRGLSARNVLEGRIDSLEQRGTIVVIRADCGVIFTVNVTPGAARSLELRPERKVWLVLKTHSCHLIAD